MARQKFHSRAKALTVAAALLLGLAAAVAVALSFRGRGIVMTEGRVTVVSGAVTDRRVQNGADAAAVADELKDTFRLSERDALVPSAEAEAVGGRVYRFDQYFRGVPVYKRGLTVDAEHSGRVRSVTGSVLPGLNLSVTPSLGADAAASRAGIPARSAALVVYGEDPALCYMIKTAGGTAFVSAHDGSQKGFEPDTVCAAAESLSLTGLDGETVTVPADYESGVYTLADRLRNIEVYNANQATDLSGKAYTSSSGAFYDTAAVTGYKNLIDIYDFYADETNLGVSLAGLDGGNDAVYGNAAARGEVTVRAYLHYGTSYSNAAYISGAGAGNTAVMIFGDGDGRTYRNFAASVEVTGHEYQHAVTDRYVSLTYLNESGAINEAISDVMGALIQGSAKNLTPADDDFWLVGEDLMLRPAYVKALRDMKDPESMRYPSSTSSPYKAAYCYLNHDHDNANCDYGGVHTNSVIISHTAYAVYEALPSFFTAENLGKLWFETVAILPDDADFVTFRIIMTQAADNLGFPAEARQAIIDAFVSAGIGKSETPVADLWEGASLTRLEGSGSARDPYLIASADDLATLAYYVNNAEAVTPPQPLSEGKYFFLTADLDLTAAEWIPAGLIEDTPFDGIFDGGGHTIRYRLPAAGGAAGLFGYVTGEVRGLTVSPVGETAASYAGGVAGVLLGGSVSRCTYDGALVSAGEAAGGIAGQSVGGRITDCVSRGSVTSAGAAGGVFGESVGSYYDADSPAVTVYGNCFNLSAVSGETAGGIAGEAVVACFVNCVNFGEVSGGTAGGITGRLNEHSASRGGVWFTAGEVSALVACRNGGKVIGTVAGGLTGTAGDPDTAGYLTVEQSICRADGPNAIGTLGGTVKGDEARRSVDPIFEGDFSLTDPAAYTSLGGVTPPSAAIFNLSGESAPTLLLPKLWTDSAADAFAGGDGTAASPYLIADASHLARLSALVSSGDRTAAAASYLVTADIDLTGRIFAGIGTDAYPFAGSFDGGGHTLTGLTCRDLYDEGAPALFSAAGGAAAVSIKNAVLSEADCAGERAAAGIVATAGKNVTVYNCRVLSGHVSAGMSAGGIAAETLDATVKACYAGAEVSGTRAGGIVGLTSAAGATNISYCAAAGKVRGLSDNYPAAIEAAGGIVGCADGSVTVANCVADAAVTAYTDGFSLGGVAGGVGDALTRIGSARISLLYNRQSGALSSYGAATVGSVSGGVAEGRGYLSLSVTLTGNRYAAGQPVSAAEGTGIILDGNAPLSGRDERLGDIDYYFDAGAWSAVDAAAANELYHMLNGAYVSFTVTFVDGEGSVLAVRTVRYGEAAEAPEVQNRVEEDCVYRLSGWDKSFDRVTGDMTVTALYEKTDANFKIERPFSPFVLFCIGVSAVAAFGLIAFVCVRFCLKKNK